MQKNPTAIQIVAAALIDPIGQVLMQRRPFAKQHGGLWEFPGGKIEMGETPTLALVRELAEELGVVADATQLRLVASAAEPDASMRIDLYICRAWRGDPCCLEGQAIDWFAPPALLDLSMPPLDVPLAMALLAAI